MPVCKRIRGRKQVICIGDLDRLITIKDREIQEPGSVDNTNKYYFTEAFGNAYSPEVWAMRISVNGKTVFDEVNVETIVTDEYYIRYDPQITAEYWIEDNGERFDIITTQDIDGDNEYMKLNCTNRGLSTNSNTGL